MKLLLLVGLSVLSVSSFASTAQLDKVGVTKVVTHYGSVDVSVLEYEDKKDGVKCYIAHTSGNISPNTAAVSGALNPNISCVKIK